MHTLVTSFVRMWADETGKKEQLVLVNVSIAVGRHHDQGNSCKGKLSTRADWFRGSARYGQGMKHGGMQTDKVLKKNPRVLHPDHQAAGKESDTETGLSIGNLKAHPQ